MNWNILITLGKKIKREYIKIPGKVRFNIWEYIKILQKIKFYINIMINLK